MGDSSQTTAAASSGNGTAQGLTAAGGAIDAYASIAAGQANKRTSRINAGLAKTQANQALEAGQIAANRVVARESQVEGADIATAAAGNTVVGAGSNARVIQSNQAVSAMDRYLIELNARREAYGYRVKAAGDIAEGNMAAREGGMRAGATLLNTGSQMWLEGDPTYGGLHGSGISFGRG